MFGYVMANGKHLSKDEKKRYGSVYCGICRQLRLRGGQKCRLVLSYDMAFLALLLMSLYEPEEISGKNACCLHPVTRRPWVENKYITYAADMNLLLAYYKCKDDYEDEGKAFSKAAMKGLQPYVERLQQQYPRQTEAVKTGLQALSALEKENCQTADLPAGVFGKILADLFWVEDDLWKRYLQDIGNALVLLPLHQFLKLRFVVTCSQHLGQLRQDQPCNDPLRGVKATVQVGRGDQGFHSIAQNAGTVTSAPLLLTVS